jgi:beta-xylosidase
MKNRYPHFVSAGLLLLATVGILTATLSASAAPSLAIPSRNWADEFSGTTINPRWSWVREDPSHWSLSANPGFLRILVQTGVINKGTNKNMLVQPAPVGDFEIETRLLFTPTENIQRAGLVIYQDNNNYFFLGRAYCNFAQCVGNGIYFDQVVQDLFIGSNFGTTTTAPGEAYLRLKQQNTDYTAYVSSNGVDWTLVGTHTTSSGFVPVKIGLIVDDAEFGGTAEIPADFDYFLLEDHSYFIYLPITRKN